MDNPGAACTAGGDVYAGGLPPGRGRLCVSPHVGAEEVKTLSVVVSAGALTVCCGAALGAFVDIGFVRIEPHNSLSNPATQLHCVLSDVSPGEVSFRFTNTVGIASSISEVYFDDGTLLGISRIIQQGCTFTGGGANPGNLPGGQNLAIPFHATQQFSADAQGNPRNGIDAAGEFLEMHFLLINNRSFDDTVQALMNGSLRIGLHLRAIGPQADSDSFVNNPTDVVGLPQGAVLGMGGMALVGAWGAFRRRRMV